MTYGSSLYGLALVSTFLLAGCLSSAPTWTVKRTMYAARDGRLAAFRGELTSDARATLGTEQELAAIGEKLARYPRLEIGPPQLTGRSDVERTYKAVVAGAARRGEPPTQLYTVFLRCTLSDETVHQDATPDSCTTVHDENGIPTQNCTPGSPAYDSIITTESCGVERIERRESKP